jgi:YidC/Oxa1 family membrane protein insertase
MEKRLIFAITLSLLVVVVWSMITPKPYPIDNKGVKAQTPSSVVSTPQSAPTFSVADKISTASLLFLTQPKREIVFLAEQAAIKEAGFKEYQNYKFPLGYGFLLGSGNMLFRSTGITQSTAGFIYSDQNTKISKEFLVSNTNYSIELRVKIQNISGAPLKIDYPLLLGVLNFSDKQNQPYQNVTIVTPAKTLHNNGQKDIALDNVQFVGIRDRYFCAIIAPDKNGCRYSVFIRKEATSARIGIQPQDLVLMPGQTSEQLFRIYLGPQDLKLINSINPDWTAVINYGTFDFISQILLQVLELIYRGVHNWGWAIIILSLLVYLLLFPLTLKQMRSMKEMQALQPHIAELRIKYKDDPKKLNTETMKLYQEHKVNPFGGCLPMLLQIPIFFALYQALMRSVFLKGASFLWIRDLSEPDRLLTSPVEINILPILMAIGMFVQQKASMKTMSTGSAEQQKMMLIFMPLLFGFIFYRMPAGLVLYWFVNSTLTLIYQVRVSRAQ